jgi:ubiquinone/menaquinone biosynthesis C-methylase UbiE
MLTNCMRNILVLCQQKEMKMVHDREFRKRQAWDEAALKEAQYYVLDSNKNWDTEDFFASGASDVERFTKDFFEVMQFNPRGKRMLDIGCGTGRMTRAFADIFSEAYGVDFSEEMIHGGTKLNKDKVNLALYVNNGRDLKLFKNEFFDFCFSYTVFQHIAEIDILVSYINEIARVLKPGGLFKFQLRSCYHFAGKIAVPRFVANFALHTHFLENDLVVGFLTRVVRRDRIKARAYPGISVSRQQLVRILDATPLEASQIIEENGLWCSGRKTTK